MSLRQPFLQMFEADWKTIDNRMVDIFKAGYGGMWVPPPNVADSGQLSVGYDVFDRFAFGAPRSETLYGTESGFRTFVDRAHDAGVSVYTDMILNHNGFSDTSTPGFLAAGDYPGFVTTLPNDIDGDFHGRFEQGEELFRLAGLIDIAQEKNHQFIRHPVEDHPDNIPSGNIHDLPNPNNARFYPDRDLGGRTVWSPARNQNVTLYDFNTNDPLQGDAVTDNATGLLMRHLRWMVQEVGVDGFRLDAARHMPRWFLDFYDEAVFLAKTEPLLDGSADHVFAFLETGYDSNSTLQSYIRKDIDDNDLGRLGGNRDALDFNLFGAIKENLTGNGFVNDWRSIKNTSIDVNDDGFANNGSQGVAFVKSHDEIGAYLDNVAHAYMLMRPGNANVYLNAKQFGDNRDFPRDGRADALGGFFGDAVTKLVQIRNSHGRGNYLDRTPSSDEKEMLIYEREKSALVVLSNRLDSGWDSRTVQTSFEPGTALVELTGNAENSTVDPFDDLPSVLVVNNDGSVNFRVPRNRSNGVEHGNGYLVYGLPTPEGELRLLDSDRNDVTGVLSGDTLGAANNGTARVNDIRVVTSDTLSVRLETDAVNLLGSIRDRHADGDAAFLKVDQGLDVNDTASVDYVSQGVAYGFENFETINAPGFFAASGDGVYEQAIDVTQLSEGMHFITARAFRHRDPSTNTDNDPSLFGDGGPAVYSDFREAIYVDRLPPESAPFSFDPFGQDFERDLVAQSLDGTADSMHIFLNLPANVTEAEVRTMALSGQGTAGDYDRDKWIFGFGDVKDGNQVVTLVTFEPTGNYNVQRFTGLRTETARGAGIGDLTFNNSFSVNDVIVFRNVLFSNNDSFNPAGDTNGDGLVDTQDLLALGQVLFDEGVDQSVLDSYDMLLLERADINQDGTTDASDIDELYASFGETDWWFDMNGDGTVDQQDVDTLVLDLLQSRYGDANLDGVVDVSDFNAWNSSKFSSGTGWAMGDFSGDSTTDISDFNIWNSNKFLSGNPLYGASPAAVPEPASGAAFAIMMLFALQARRRGEMAAVESRKDTLNGRTRLRE